MKEPLIKPSDLRSMSQELIESGKMPSLDDVLSAISETRKEYRQQILDARKTPHDPGIAALGEKTDTHQP